MRKRVQQRVFDKVEFRMHPRVFAALGADLVTNDVVAVIELVKNSYDAFAANVRIRFKSHPKLGDYLEIEDDGLGMSQEVIRDTWCLVATPYRQTHPFTKSGKKQRRVSGEKGLGRLSVARLGDRLRMITQAPGEPCWDVRVNWKTVAGGPDLSAAFAELREYDAKPPFKTSGTQLRIFGLNGKWDDKRISDLEDNLARLVSPFTANEELSIYLSPPGAETDDTVRIEAPDFLNKPKYCIAGDVNAAGRVTAKYRFNPVREGRSREKALSYSWEQVYDSIRDKDQHQFVRECPHCGSFAFEIRAWDIASDDTQEIADRFEFQRNRIRKAIGAHKGISVYRDGILVLPKSDGSRDWLGLDLRRVSKVGTRMSTSQLVGYVAISAEHNPDIEDTSDRERLVDRLPVREFEELLKAIVGMLENERDIDRIRHDREKPLKNLFGQLETEKLLSDVSEMAQEGMDASDVLPVMRRHIEAFDTARDAIQQRFVYYSRLATVGTIAQMLVHEIRNRTTSFGAFMSFAKNFIDPVRDKELAEEFEAARESVNSLERLADTFAPLASRGFRRRKRDSILEERIRTCLDLEKREIERKEIACDVPPRQTRVAVDPGELDAILLNLINNAVFWLGNVQDRKRQIAFQVSPITGGKRVSIWVHDNGPGIVEEDRKSILTPGFTRKPGGIGMGLTVVSELVAEYDGALAVASNPLLGGASFMFDLPLKKG